MREISSRGLSFLTLVYILYLPLSLRWCSFGGGLGILPCVALDCLYSHLNFVVSDLVTSDATWVAEINTNLHYAGNCEMRNKCMQGLFTISLRPRCSKARVLRAFYTSLPSYSGFTFHQPVSLKPPHAATVFTRIIQ